MSYNFQDQAKPSQAQVDNAREALQKIEQSIAESRAQSREITDDQRAALLRAQKDFDQAQLARDQAETTAAAALVAEGKQELPQAIEQKQQEPTPEQLQEQELLLLKEIQTSLATLTKEQDALSKLEQEELVKKKFDKSDIKKLQEQALAMDAAYQKVEELLEQRFTTVQNNLEDLEHERDSQPHSKASVSPTPPSTLHDALSQYLSVLHEKHRKVETCRDIISQTVNMLTVLFPLCTKRQEELLVLPSDLQDNQSISTYLIEQGSSTVERYQKLSKQRQEQVLQLEQLNVLDQHLGRAFAQCSSIGKLLEVLQAEKSLTEIRILDQAEKIQQQRIEALGQAGNPVLSQFQHEQQTSSSSATPAAPLANNNPNAGPTLRWTKDSCWDDPVR